MDGANDLNRADPSDLRMVCEFMLYLADSSRVLAAFAIKFMCGVLGFILLIVVFAYRKANKSLHRNANVILNFHYGLTMVSCIAVALNDGFDLFRLTVFRKPAGKTFGDCGIFAMPAYVGFWFRLLTFCGNAGSSLTITALAIERSYATFYAQTYEKRGNKYLGVILCSLCIFFCFGIGAYISPAVNLHRHLPMQSMTPEAVPRVTNAALVLAIFEFFNAVLFAILWLLNFLWKRQSNRIFATLTHKYQRKENMQSVSVLLPLAVLHLTIAIGSYILTEMGSLASRTHQEVLMVIITRDIYPLYVFLMPLYTLVYEYKTRRILKFEQTQNRFSVQPDVPREQDGHFQMLKDMFDTQFDKRS